MGVGPRADRRVTPLTGAREITGGEFSYSRVYFEEYGRGSFTGRNWFTFALDEAKQELRLEVKGRHFSGRYEVRADGMVIVTRAGRALLRLVPGHRASPPNRS